MKIPRLTSMLKLFRGNLRPAPIAVPSRIAATIDRALRDAGLVRDAAPSPRPSVEPEAPASSPPLSLPAPPPADTDRAPDAQGSFVTRALRTAGGERPYKLFTPAASTGPRPLVVMLHGCTQDPDDFALGTRMNELAQAQGIHVLYPMQRPNDNASRCWNWFRPSDQTRDRGEPAAIAAMTRQVMQDAGIDARRVYVAGLSAGGAMASILAREYPELYAAVGVHSGLAARAAQDVGSAFAAMHGRAPRTAPADRDRLRVPVIVFHGARDLTVHPVNARTVIESHRVGESLGVQRAEAGRGYTREVFQGGVDSVDGECWILDGGGHAWFGGSTRGSHVDPDGPDASAEMLRFFLEHARTASAD
jgi:poly(hydroxyalkanoate) depolymerase family esterase